MTIPEVKICKKIDLVAVDITHQTLTSKVEGVFVGFCRREDCE